MTFQFNLQFDDGHLTSTSLGTRRVQTASPTEEFWKAWRQGKEGLQAKGYSVRKTADGWRVHYWTSPTQAPPEEKESLMEPPLPRLKDTSGLLPHQPPMVQSVLGAVLRYGAALDASDTGVGKTFAALATAREMGVRPVVVATRNTVVAWERAAAMMGVQPALVSTWDKVKLGNTVAGKPHPEGFRWDRRIKLLILDEIHRASGAATQNAGLVVSAKRQGIPTIGLSASAADSPMQMRALGFLLGLHDDKGFLQWMMSHGCYLDAYEKWQFGGTEEDLKRIHRAIFPQRGVRLRKADIPGFPQTQVTAELVPVTDPNAVTKAYRDLHEAIRKVRAKEVGEEERANHLTAMLRANQITELSKVPATIDIAKEWLAEGLSVVVGCQFTDTISTIANSFGGVKVGTITGESTDKARQKVMDAFQSDAIRVVVMNQAVEGIGLHDVRGRYPRGSLLLPGFRPLAVKQFLGRIHRAEGKSKSIQRILFAAGCPVEERKAQRLTERLSGMSILNDGVDLPVTEEDLMGLFET